MGGPETGAAGSGRGCGTAAGWGAAWIAGRIESISCLSPADEGCARGAAAGGFSLTTKVIAKPESAAQARLAMNRPMRTTIEVEA